ncbi:MAG TPA: hypothetical protein VE650_13395 [Acetobacteraceae bacterium]|nr:hypothetical protein [Acetobacteraceae bacterium]
MAIRALRSINRDVLETVTRAVAGVCGAWCVAAHDSYDGYLSILVSPETETQPTYVISGAIGRIELARLHEDVLETIGTFNTADAAATALATAIRVE